MGKIIGIGNALVDVLVTVTEEDLKALGISRGSMQLIDMVKYEELNRWLSSAKTTCATGGSAANAVLALSGLGMETGFIGKIGKDDYGRFFVQAFQKHGVDLHLSECGLHTGVASTFVSEDGERTFATYLGAAATMTAAEVCPEHMRGYDCLYVEGYLVQDHQLIESVMDMACRAGLKVALDMASYNVVAADRAFFAHLLSHYVDIVLANEEEARAFTGKEPEKALADLSGLCETVVVKLGAGGAMACSGGCRVWVEAEQVSHVVDTTAAGDFFAGGFLYGLMAGVPLERCVRLGNLMGGRVVRVIGTSFTPADWDEIRLNVAGIVG